MDSTYKPDNRIFSMSINTLYTIYNAGFNHGINEGPFPKHGTFDAFNRLIEGESPTLDGDRYDIKHKITISTK